MLHRATQHAALWFQAALSCCLALAEETPCLQYKLSKRNTAMITSAGLSLPDQSSSVFEAQLGALDRPNQLPAPKALQSQSTHTKTSHFAKSQVQCRLSMQQPPPQQTKCTQNHRVDKTLMLPCRACSPEQQSQPAIRSALLPQSHCSPNSKPYPHLSPLQPKQNNHSVHQRQQRHWPKEGHEAVKSALPQHPDDAISCDNASHQGAACSTA